MDRGRTVSWTDARNLRRDDARCVGRDLACTDRAAYGISENHAAESIRLRERLVDLSRSYSYQSKTTDECTAVWNCKPGDTRCAPLASNRYRNCRGRDAGELCVS